jgi:hypothetical protein
MQLLACALLCAGGAALLGEGYLMGGGTAIAVAALLALMTLGRPNRW